jgi:hypothetical protein
MSDKDLGKALLKFDLTPPGAATAVQVDRIIEEDRRRVRWLARLTVVLWILAALGALLIFIVGGLVFPLIAKTLNDAGKAAEVAKALNDAGQAAPSQIDTAFLLLAKLLAVCIVVGFLSFVLLVAAGLATVVLVFRSRRATLRQINANLLQISEQLKTFTSRQPLPGG